MKKKTMRKKNINDARDKKKSMRDEWISWWIGCRQTMEGEIEASIEEEEIRVSSRKGKESLKPSIGENSLSSLISLR